MAKKATYRNEPDNAVDADKALELDYESKLDQAADALATVGNYTPLEVYLGAGAKIIALCESRRKMTRHHNRGVDVWSKKDFDDVCDSAATRFAVRHPHHFRAEGGGAKYRVDLYPKARSLVNLLSNQIGEERASKIPWSTLVNRVIKGGVGYSFDVSSYESSFSESWKDFIVGLLRDLADGAITPESFDARVKAHKEGLAAGKESNPEDEVKKKIREAQRKRKEARTRLDDALESAAEALDPADIASAVSRLVKDYRITLPAIDGQDTISVGFDPVSATAKDWQDALLALFAARNVRALRTIASKAAQLAALLESEESATASEASAA